MMPSLRFPLRPLIWIACGLALQCGADPAMARTDVVVSAAASLKPAFTALIKRFETRQPALRIRSNFASSTQLASQISQGAKVDVYASADRKTMEQLVANRLVKVPTAFAYSSLTIVLANKGPTTAPALTSLSAPGARIVMPSPKIPAAGYIEAFLRKADAAGIADGQYSARLRANTVSHEPDARMVVTKVALGEADGAIVYATDITPDIRPRVKEVAIPPELNVRAEYLVGLVQRDAEVAGASQFHDFVRSAEGRSILHSFGFLTD